MFSVVIVCYAARAACSPFDGAAAMTEAHRQVCQEGQRHHIILLSPAAQRCRLAAFWKHQEGVDVRAGLSVELDAGETPKDDYYSL